MKVKHFIMIVMLMLIVMMLTGPVMGASTDTAVSPALTVATFYDFGADELLLGGIISVINFNKIISVDAGILTEMSSISYMLGLGIDLKELANYFKWKWDLSENMKVGTYGARDFKTKNWRYGLYVGLKLDI